eukprot:scaffold231756_cov21-Tisochrysis_lutea.AAC.1
MVQRLKNRKEWAYTDGSCHIQHGRQETGARVYHPDSLNFVHPNKAGINNTILQDHSHIQVAFYNLSSLQQTRKQTLYPKLNRQHVQ